VLGGRLRDAIIASKLCGRLIVGYISSYVDEVNDGQRHRVAFVLSTVHPAFTTLSRGELFPTSRPAVVPEDAGGAAQLAAVGFVSEEVDWLFFSTWGPGKPDWHWPGHANAGGSGEVEFDHIERVVLTILEGINPDSEVFGSLKNPNWKDEIPLRKLTVQDHQANGLVLSGFDGNGAAIGITLQTF
jgi:hypothetical protein